MTGTQAAQGFPLEPIEKAPLADLRKLQLQRLQWSLRHAYDHAPHYRGKFAAAAGTLLAVVSGADAART